MKRFDNIRRVLATALVILSLGLALALPASAAIQPASGSVVARGDGQEGHGR